MTLQELRYLVALADHRHFGRAAEACHISQPTLSAQLKKLEDFLGVVLFERTSKSLKLTAAGEPILAKARLILIEAGALVALAREAAKPMTGRMNLGVIPTLGPYLLPWALPVLKASFPDLQLVLQEEMTAGLLAGLQSHRLDAALLALPAEGDDLTAQALFEEPFLLACPKDHALAKAKAVEAEALAKAPLLLLADGHCLRDQALAVCGQIPAAGEAADFRATSLETIRQMVAAGLGCTLLPALATGTAHPAIAIRPLKNEAFRRIGLVWRKSHPKQTDMAMLSQALESALPGNVRRIGQSG